MKTVLWFLGIAMMAVAVTAGVNYVRLPGELAQIDQLRKDAGKVAAQSSEDVIGQVTQWNQKIVSYQTYNAIPLIELMIPDFWSEVEPIPVPEMQESEVVE